MLVLSVVGWSLIHSSWQGVVIWTALSAILHLKWFVEPSRRYRCAAYALVFVVGTGIATAFVVRTDLVRPSGPEAGTLVSTSRPLGIPSESLPVSGADVANRDIMRLGRLDVRALQGAVGGLLSSLAPLLALAWLFGALFGLFRLGIAYMRLRHEVLGSFEKNDTQIGRRIAELAEGMRLRGPVRWLESSLVRSPMVAGLVQPVLVLPSGIGQQVHGHQLDAVLLHELSHIRRRDPQWAVPLAVVGVLYFYHPYVRRILARVALEREIACDAIAAEALGDRLLYARALVSFSAVASGVIADSLHVGLSSAALTLRLRVAAVLRRPDSPVRLEGYLGAAASVLFTVALSTVPAYSSADASGRAAPMPGYDEGVVWITAVGPIRHVTDQGGIPEPETGGWFVLEERWPSGSLKLEVQAGQEPAVAFFRDGSPAEPDSTSWRWVEQVMSRPTVARGLASLSVSRDVLGVNGRISATSDLLSYVSVVQLPLSADRSRQASRILENELVFANRRIALGSMDWRATRAPYEIEKHLVSHGLVTIEEGRAFVARLDALSLP